MSIEQPSGPERYFAASPAALQVYRLVRAVLESIGPVDVRTTRSQVAFRRQRGFAYLWIPVEWARGSGVAVVLSIALGREDGSQRWKQVVHPSAGIWMHHLEVREAGEVDGAVREWLSEAYAAAG